MSNSNFSNIINSSFEKVDGILKTKSVQKISYPDDGSDACFEVEESSYWFKHRCNLLSDILVKLNIPQNSLFLDIGGGNGLMTKTSQDLGITSVLIEPGKGVTNAKERGVHNIIKGVSSDIKNAQQKISTIGIFDVLEHVKDDENLLKDLFRILPNNGNLIIMVPAHQSLWSNEDLMAGHFRRYSIKELTNKAKKAGFTVKNSNHFFSFLYLPILLIRAFPFKIGIPHRNKKPSTAAHTQSQGIIYSLINSICNLEQRLINTGLKIPLGSSILLIAKK